MTTKFSDRVLFLTDTLIQGSADAWESNLISTGVTPSDDAALEIIKIEVSFPDQAGLQGITADCRAHWGIHRDTTDTALPTLADYDAIYQDGFHHALTTSEGIIIPALFEYTPPPGVFVVEPNLLTYIDSTGVGTALTAVMRIYYKLVRVSELEKLRILSNA